MLTAKRVDYLSVVLFLSRYVCSSWFDAIRRDTWKQGYGEIILGSNCSAYRCPDDFYSLSKFGYRDRKAYFLK